MDTTDEKLSAAAREGPKSYYKVALQSTRYIHERLTAPDRLTAVIVGTDVRRLKELLAASLVLNDCTSVVFNDKSEIKVSLPEPHQYREMFGCDAVRFNITPDQIKEHGIDPINPLIRPCLFYSDSQAQRPLMNALIPFIERGGVVFQPTRGVMAKKEEAHAWHIVGVDRKQPLDLWEPDPQVSVVKPTPLEAQVVDPKANALFEVTLPFLKGVPLCELDAMLTDESDLVVAFRSAIRSTVREATKSGATVAEMVNDVVKPKVIALDRKLRSLQRIHRLKVGGAAMSSVALAFTSASVGSLGGSLLAVASAGGFGFIANQYSDYLAKRDELHEDPYYFLWKLRRASTPGA